LEVKSLIQSLCGRQTKIITELLKLQVEIVESEDDHLCAPAVTHNCWS
jgi:hypothetical protein